MDTTTWTEAQRQAYAKLMGNFERAEADRKRREAIFGKAPKDGWKESDRVAK